jgi:serine/threonine protein phosphatase PrpC
LGVFDGHAPLGERVSEHTAAELPKLLANKLSSKAKQAVDENVYNSKVLSDRVVMQLTKAALIETFVELDRTAPANPSGGCTASVVLWQDSKIYIANAGDSRSFIVAYRPSTNNVTVAYISREDKPSLPDERARIEAYGGQVYIPARGTSRVVYHDSTTGAPTGLAMSRSIGDWEAGQMGVIPDPIVDIIDVRSMIARILLEDDGDATDPDAYQVDPVGHILDPAEYLSTGDHHLVGGEKDDVYLFAVSATDGMMDYLQETQIARVLAHSLFHEAGAHPIAAAEHLIFAAANAWQDAKQGRYRDDIAIAVSALRRPPSRDERNRAPMPRPTEAAQ